MFEGKLQREASWRPELFTREMEHGLNTAFGRSLARDDNEDYEKVPLHEILREEGSALSSRVPRIP